MKRRANSFDNQDSRLHSKHDDEFEEGPSVEWLPDSDSERDKCDMGDQLGSLRDQNGRICDTSEILNMTGVRDLKQMEKARENLDSKSKREPDNGQVVLDKQILDIKIEQKIKMVRSSQIQRKAARSHRQDIREQSLKNPMKNMSPDQRSDIKARSLKDSQVIAQNLKKRYE